MRTVGPALGLWSALAGACNASIGGESGEPDAAVATCDPDQLECPDGCIDPLTDETHCGATGCGGSSSGAECASDQACIEGTCQVVPLGSIDRPALSCRAILDQGFSVGDGPYYVDPDGFRRAVPVHCDMTGGGITYWVFDGLQAYWSFDSNTPGRADIGTFIGTLEAGAAASATVLAPSFGSSLRFVNEETDRLSMANGVLIGAQSTFVFWTRHTSCANNKIPFYFADTSYMGDLRFGTGQVHVVGNAELVMGTKLPGNCTDTLGTWIHHVYVDDGTNLRYYRNGTNVPPDVYHYVPLAGLVLSRFGSRPGFNTNGLAGQIDDVAVFDRALTDTEIAELHGQGALGRPLRWR